MRHNRPHLTVALRTAHNLVHVVKVDWHPQRPQTVPRRFTLTGVSSLSQTVVSISSTNQYRYIGALEKAKASIPGTVALCEMDSHANTCVTGPNFRIDEYTGEHCDVTPYF